MTTWMRTITIPLQTVRHALLAAVVALAVAAPAPFVIDHFLSRPATPVATPAPARPAAAAHSPPATATRAGQRRVKARPALPGPGLPGSIVVALKASPLVVVALYAAGDTVDMAASSEAEAGAEAAQVPFVAINVGDESQIGDLASRLQSLTVPSVIVLGRPGRVVKQLEGWADKETVAGAVDTARAP